MPNAAISQLKQPFNLKLPKAPPKMNTTTQNLHHKAFPRRKWWTTMEEEGCGGKKMWKVNIKCINMFALYT